MSHSHFQWTDFSENLAEYLSSAVDEISKENQGENANLAKPKKSKKKKVKFAGQEDSELLSEVREIFVGIFVDSAGLTFILLIL